MNRKVSSSACNPAQHQLFTNWFNCRGRGVRRSSISRSTSWELNELCFLLTMEKFNHFYKHCCERIEWFVLIAVVKTEYKSKNFGARARYGRDVLATMRPTLWCLATNDTLYITPRRAVSYAMAAFYATCIGGRHGLSLMIQSALSRLWLYLKIVLFSASTQVSYENYSEN